MNQIVIEETAFEEVLSEIEERELAWHRSENETENLM